MMDSVKSGYVDISRLTIEDFKQVEGFRKFERLKHISLVARTTQQELIYVLKTVSKKNKDAEADAKSELAIMQTFSKNPHSNILPLLKSFDSNIELKLLLPYMKVGDLEGYTRSIHAKRQSNTQKVFDDPMSQRIVKGIAAALKHMHSLRIMHRDIKPKNVFLDESFEPKVADFGFSRQMKSVNEIALKRVVGTYSFMAPEMVIDLDKERSKRNAYGMELDMWSYGATVFFFFTNRYLLISPDSFDESFTRKDIKIKILKGDTFDHLKKELPKKLEKITDPLARNFLKRLLKVNVNNRMSAEQALCHRYLTPEKGQSNISCSIL